ncbi:zn(2)-cys(6) zinc finger domain protein [Fusarium flagelliforme]|uniref:Zn(2)-cys(6) zinc finger domain protein n=1 Tax=Fusarium flagelliforme TaxID=2675880 RepID=A0A395MYW6_9HYPO|nr:zn(2)-cys(6) zinc finger domain protein [Fusarium flagelliforme]
MPEIGSEANKYTTIAPILFDDDMVSTGVCKDPALNQGFQRRLPDVSPAYPLSLSSPLARYSHLPCRDEQLLQHIYTNRAKLERVLKSGLLVGIQQIARCCAMVAKYPYAGDCLKSISASHLRSLTKSTAMACMEHELRARAIHGMATELRKVQDQGTDIRKETLECLDVSSKLLSWYSATPNEYAGFLKGVLALNSVHYKQSEVQGSRQSYKAASSENLNAVGDALRLFIKCDLDTELKLATQELLDFVHNLSWSLATTSPESHEAQLKLLYPIRSWLRLVPCAPNRLYAGDFMVHLFLANYEMLMFTVSLNLPHINLPLAIEDRRAGLERYYLFVKHTMATRFLRDSNVANLTRVYEACFQWKSSVEGLMKDSQVSPQQILWSEWQGMMVDVSPNVSNNGNSSSKELPCIASGR